MMDATCTMCANCTEPDFYLRCGHYFHKTCLEKRFSEEAEITCPTCKTRISLRQAEEHLDAFRADHKLCFTDLQHLKLALELVESGQLSYENEAEMREITQIAESLGLKKNK